MFLANVNIFLLAHFKNTVSHNKRIMLIVLSQQQSKQNNMKILLGFLSLNLKIFNNLV